MKSLTPFRTHTVFADIAMSWISWLWLPHDRYHSRWGHVRLFAKMNIYIFFFLQGWLLSMNACNRKRKCPCRYVKRCPCALTEHHTMKRTVGVEV